MDIARPQKSAVPTTPLRPPATSEPVPATPAVSLTPTASSTPTSPAATPPPAPKPAVSTTPAGPAHPQLEVRQAPLDGDAAPSKIANNDVSANTSKDHKKDAPATEETPVAHATVPKNTGPHAPVGVIVLTVIGMIVLSSVAIMVYLNGQK